MNIKIIIITLFFLPVINSCENKTKHNTQKEGVVEITAFKVKVGTDRDKFIQAATAIKPYLTGCDGFVSRKLLELNDSSYSDIIFWNSREDAENAAKKSMENEKVINFFNYIDFKSIDMKYYIPKIEF